MKDKNEDNVFARRGSSINDDTALGEDRRISKYHLWTTPHTKLPCFTGVYGGSYCSTFLPLKKIINTKSDNQNYPCFFHTLE